MRLSILWLKESTVCSVAWNCQRHLRLNSSLISAIPSGIATWKWHGKKSGFISKCHSMWPERVGFVEDRVKWQISEAFPILYYPTSSSNLQHLFGPGKTKERKEKKGEKKLQHKLNIQPTVKPKWAVGDCFFTNNLCYRETGPSCHWFMVTKCRNFNPVVLSCVK